MNPEPLIVVANMLRAPSEQHARVINDLGWLRIYATGRRNFTAHIPPARQVRQPFFGLYAYITGRLLSTYTGECARFEITPIFDAWVRGCLRPSDSLLSGLGYLNHSMEYVRDNGGLNLLEARNSHPSQFWTLVAEEHAIWNCTQSPIWPRHHMRQQRSVTLADYIFVPSAFVEDSFLARGIPPTKLLRLPYPVDFTLFKPPAAPRPASRPFTLVSSGFLSLRKGSPYLFEAFKQIRKIIPGARLKLLRGMTKSFRRVYERFDYDKLPVEWASLAREQLTPWMQDADVFLLPTIEEGMVRSAAEALACGLPVITTPHAGLDGQIVEGVNGSLVPIRDPAATAGAALAWWDRIQRGQYDARSTCLNHNDMSYETFAWRLGQHLRKIYPQENS